MKEPKDSYNNLIDLEFNEIISPHKQALWQYCLQKTRNQWDAEDLTQETLMKAYRSFQKSREVTITKSFLFRIAENTWIDQLRKKKLTTEELNEEYHTQQHDTDLLEVRETFEELIRYLTIKQIVILLLTNVFKFKAKETAHIISITENDVHTTLHRCRSKLKALAPILAGQKEFNQVKLKRKNQESEYATNASQDIIESFIQAFKSGSPEAIYHSYQALLDSGLTVKRLDASSETTVCFSFIDPDGNKIQVSS